MYRKTIVLLIAALFFATSYAALNSNSSCGEDGYDNPDFIMVSTDDDDQYPETCTWDESGDTAYLNLNGVHVKSVYIESDKPLVITLNGDNYIETDTSATYAMLILSDENVTITGNSLKINVTKDEMNYHYGIYRDYYYDNGSNDSIFSIDGATITITSDCRTYAEIAYEESEGIGTKVPMEIKNSVIEISYIYCGIQGYNDAQIEIVNSLIEFNNPASEKTYAFIISSEKLILDKKPVSDYEMEYYDENNILTQWEDGDVCSILTHGDAVIDNRPVASDLPMQATVIACALIAVFCFGYALFGKK